MTSRTSTRQRDETRLRYSRCDFPYHLSPAEGSRPFFASEDTITWRKSGSNAELKRPKEELSMNTDNQKKKEMEIAPAVLSAHSTVYEFEGAKYIMTGM